MADYYPPPYDVIALLAATDSDSLGSSVLIQAGELEVVRLVVSAGHELHRDPAPSGWITLHVLKGSVEVRSPDIRRALRAGELVHFPATQPGLLAALEDSVVLATGVRCPICYQRPGADA